MGEVAGNGPVEVGGRVRKKAIAAFKGGSLEGVKDSTAVTRRKRTHVRGMFSVEGGGFREISKINSGRGELKGGWRRVGKDG